VKPYPSLHAFHPSLPPLGSFSFFSFIFFASRPPVGGIDDGAGGLAHGWHTALLGNDREQRLYGFLKKLWLLGACKNIKLCAEKILQGRLNNARLAMRSKCFRFKVANESELLIAVAPMSKSASSIKAF